MFMLVMLGGKRDRHDVLLFNAPSKEMKNKWLSLLMRLSIEGHAYTQSIGKYSYVRYFRLIFALYDSNRSLLEA